MSSPLSSLLAVPDPDLQAALARVREPAIALALHGADAAVRDKVLRNLSARRRERVAEEEAATGSPPPRSVAVARESLLRTVFPEGAPPAPDAPGARPRARPPAREDFRRFVVHLTRTNPALKELAEEKKRRLIREWLRRQMGGGTAGGETKA